jgi:predicted amidohydrolase
MEISMKDIKVTIASLPSILADPYRNLELVEEACKKAREHGSRIILLPELMLTGHGAHPKMIENAEMVPDGTLCCEIIKFSYQYQLCICVGIAELANNLVYNSQIVVDHGVYKGLQRKIYLSGDEYLYFATGKNVEVFDIGDVKFGITICYDNNFPEISLIHSLHKVDLILAAHAARTREWPDILTKEFKLNIIEERQRSWEKMFCGTAFFHNVYILACNAVGSSTEGLEGIVANHAGTVFGVEPSGDVFLRTSVNGIVNEIATVELKSEKRKLDHRPSLNRRVSTVKELFEKTFTEINV